MHNPEIIKISESISILPIIIPEQYTAGSSFVSWINFDEFSLENKYMAV